MRNYIIYILTGFFLLFLAGSSVVNSNTSSTHISKVTAHSSFSKKNSPKFSIAQIVDNTTSNNSELEEYDFQLSDTLESILFFASVFGLILAFGILFKKRLKTSIVGVFSNIRLIKKFILIRSIRI